LLCRKCILRSVSLVVPPHTTVAAPCVACGRRAAAICAECHDRTARNVRELTNANIALSVVRGDRGQS
jgi:hypothetical protein